ncbi:peripherin [Gadus macrocephalus]|uniref:peripherin n=1 Tax=Gadus macrocephalus TaxID=80720 RepID=UPI0028CB643F|nr:peripherin [Gadus macrocephalus]
MNREPFVRPSLRLRTMAMLRVSSYRRLFEEQCWRQNGASVVSRRSPGRAGAADECQCDKYDFASAKALNKEGLVRFTQDHTVLSGLNNRLVRLIELARCFEEENEFLESQILDLEESGPSAGVSGTGGAVADCSLDAAVERLRRERDDILCDTVELQKELQCLRQEFEKALQQRTSVQHARLDLAEEVDAVTAECLALREQAEIYEQQLVCMEAQRSTAVQCHESQGPLGPLGTPESGARLEFCSPDITPGLQIKAYYGQLAESLQCECGKSSPSSSLVPSHDPLREEGVSGPPRSKGKDSPKMADSGELKELVGQLQKELAELQKGSVELEDEVEVNGDAHQERIEELECTLEDMRAQQLDFEDQIQDQCEDYQELLCEKRTRDLEIAAYRGLVAEEDDRLCHL